MCGPGPRHTKLATFEDVIHAPTGSERQQLHEQRRVASAELGRRHATIVDRNLELAQHANRHAHDAVSPVVAERLQRAIA